MSRARPRIFLIIPLVAAVGGALLIARLFITSPRHAEEARSDERTAAGETPLPAARPGLGRARLAITVPPDSAADLRLLFRRLLRTDRGGARKRSGREADGDRCAAGDCPAGREWIHPLGGRELDGGRHQTRRLPRERRVRHRLGTRYARQLRSQRGRRPRHRRVGRRNHPGRRHGAGRQRDRLSELRAQQQPGRLRVGEHHRDFEHGSADRRSDGCRLGMRHAR